MNYLSTLPPKKRFHAALVCLPLMYVLGKALMLGLTWASTREGMLPVFLVGVPGIIAIAKVQRIAATIVDMFERQ
ncbi:UNVERIFIED_ORG: hypothetical protein BDU10_9630 [Burkholderia sp. CF145]